MQLRHRNFCCRAVQDAEEDGLWQSWLCKIWAGTNWLLSSAVRFCAPPLPSVWNVWSANPMHVLSANARRTWSQKLLLFQECNSSVGARRCQSNRRKHGVLQTPSTKLCFLFLYSSVDDSRQNFDPLDPLSHWSTASDPPSCLLDCSIRTWTELLGGSEVVDQSERGSSGSKFWRETSVEEYKKRKHRFVLCSWRLLIVAYDAFSNSKSNGEQRKNDCVLSRKQPSAFLGDVPMRQGNALEEARRSQRRLHLAMLGCRMPQEAVYPTQLFL